MPGVHGGGMSLLSFYARNSQEVLGLVGQHVYLVAISTGAAIVIGVPLGVLLTRRPGWRGPVLGVANVFQTVPSLALFGFLIPLPFIGGIGPRTAIVALVLYALLPIGRNTHEGVAGLDPAVALSAAKAWWAPRTSPSPICGARSGRSKSSGAGHSRWSDASTWGARSCATRPSRRAKSIYMSSTRGRPIPPY